MKPIWVVLFLIGAAALTVVLWPWNPTNSGGIAHAEKTLPVSGGNDPNSDEMVSDDPILLEFVSHSPCVIIGTKRGEMRIHFEHDHCVIEDPCGVMDEGARLFFEKYLKDIANHYIADRLRGKSQ